jgi:hypothetical protein
VAEGMLTGYMVRKNTIVVEEETSMEDKGILKAFIKLIKFGLSMNGK